MDVVSAPDAGSSITRRAVSGLLISLPPDNAFWLELESRYTVQLRMSTHTAGWNRGFCFTATLALIANTPASVAFDLYAEGEGRRSNKSLERTREG